MLRFQGPKSLAAWLRSPRGRRIRNQCVAEVESSWVEAEPRLPESLFALKPRVLIVTEGMSVTVYVEGEVIVRHVDRPVCRTPTGNDLADKLVASRIGPWWEGLKYRMTIWTSSRSLRERVFDAAVSEV